MLWYYNSVFSLLVPPKFIEKIKSVSTVVGDAAVFRCSVEGPLPLSVLWKKDENWIQDDPKIKQIFQNKEATLRVLACEAIHGGKYTCHVVNEAGQDVCSATLTVQGTFTSSSLSTIRLISNYTKKYIYFFSFWHFRTTND